MYTPAAFRQDDLATLHQQIRATRLPTLVSHGTQGLLASHLPLLLEADEGPYGKLYGHFANISPSWYAAKAEHGKVVPTWNYISVQAHGRAEVFDDAERLLQLVSRLSALHEAERPQPWAVSDAPRDYIDSMLRAIVGFALPIERLEGKWKLVQNRRQADQAGVREGLAASLDPRDRELAAKINNQHLAKEAP